MTKSNQLTKEKSNWNPHLRNLDLDTKNKIEEQLRQVNERNRKNKVPLISTNEFLSRIIRRAAGQPFFDYEKTIFDEAVEQMSGLIQEYLKATNRVFYLLLTDDKEGALDLYSKLVHDRQLEEFIQGDLYD